MGESFPESHYTISVYFRDFKMMVCSDLCSFHFLSSTCFAILRSSIRVVQAKDTRRFLFLHGMDTYAEFQVGSMNYQGWT